MRIESPTAEWILAGHLVGDVFWICGLFAVYWLLRVHSHAPVDARDQLTLMERSLALMTDIAATVAIGCGIALAVTSNRQHPTSTLFTAAGAGWFHAKLAIVILGLLPVHGMLRAKVKKFSDGKISPMPQWLWNLFLLSITLIILAAITHFQVKSDTSPPDQPPAATSK